MSDRSSWTPHPVSGQPAPGRRYTPGVGDHAVTADTPRRPGSSFYEIAAPEAYEEMRLGRGGGVGSERHIQDLMGGMSAVTILAMALASSLAFPPLWVVWLAIGVWVLLVEVVQPYGRRVLAEEERARAEAAGLLPSAQVRPADPWSP